MKHGQCGQKVSYSPWSLVVSLEFPVEQRQFVREVPQISSGRALRRGTSEAGLSRIGIRILLPRNDINRCREDVVRIKRACRRLQSVGNAAPDGLCMRQVSRSADGDDGLLSAHRALIGDRDESERGVRNCWTDAASRGAHAVSGQCVCRAVRRSDQNAAQSMCLGRETISDGRSRSCRSLSLANGSQGLEIAARGCSAGRREGKIKGVRDVVAL